MKIGMVSKFPEQEDGISLYAASLCEELEHSGVTVVKIGDNESSTAQYKINFKSFSLKSKLQQIANQEKLDMLHVQYIASHFSKYTFNLNLILALNQKVPVLVTLHEVHTAASTLREKILTLIQKAITKKASAVVVHTKQQKEFLQLKYKKKQAFCILHGLILNPMHKLRDKNLLFFGMLNYGKGVEYLIRAVSELPGFRLTVAGKAITPHYEQIVRAAAEENKTGNVKLDIRWIPEEEKKRLLQEADIMVFPYVWAPYQSGTMHNAFSYGVPVVVTNTGPIGEIVKEYRCGRVIEPRSPKSIAAGIRAVLGNYDIYQDGIEKYRQEANWRTTAQKHAEIYNEILQEYYEHHNIIEEEKYKKAKLAEEIAKDESED